MKIEKQNFFDKKIYKKQFNSDSTSLLWIINKQFWKSWLSPFFAFVFPVFFIGILGGILGYNLFFGPLLTVASASIGLISLSQAIYEFKSSVLLKRIGSSKITVKRFLLTIVGYYFLIMTIATIFSFLMSFVLFLPYFWEGKNLFTGTFEVLSPVLDKVKIQSSIIAYSFLDNLKAIDYPGAIYGFVVSFGVSAAMGILVASLAKSTMSLQAISVPTLILSQFLAGQVMALQFIVPVDALRYLGYFVPFKGPTSVIIQSMQGIPIENWDQSAIVDLTTLNAHLNSTDFDANLKALYPLWQNGDTELLVKSLQEKFEFSNTNLELTLENKEFTKWFTEFQTFMGEEIGKINQVNVKSSGLMPDQMQGVAHEVTLIPSNIDITVAKHLKLESTSPFDITHDFRILDKSYNAESIQGFSKIEKVINLVIPWIWMAGLWAISLKTFKWDLR